VTQFKRIIDNVRNSKYHTASEENKAVFKGFKYPLLKIRKKICLTPSSNNLTIAGIKSGDQHHNGFQRAPQTHLISA
jgi:hypothetical protein